jgi:hypothetical protein
MAVVPARGEQRVSGWLQRETCNAVSPVIVDRVRRSCASVPSVPSNWNVHSAAELSVLGREHHAGVEMTGVGPCCGPVHLRRAGLFGAGVFERQVVD